MIRLLRKTACLALCWMVCASGADASISSFGEQAEPAERPFVALWRRSEGSRAGGSGAPYLRFAVWSDGRFLVAKDPTRWGHNLRRGKLTDVQVAGLKAALANTGVLDLTGTCYLVPDAPVDCLLVDLGSERRQLLYWDEVETSGYGINIAPKPQHIAFMRCWKAINRLALTELPDDGEPVQDRVQIPDAWYIKRAIQSE